VEFIAALWIVWIITFLIGLAGVLFIMLNPLLLIIACAGGFKGFLKMCFYIMLVSIIFLVINVLYALHVM
jgi:hypothetical protein